MTSIFLNVFLVIFIIKKKIHIIIHGSAYLCYIQTNIGSETVHALCVLHLH